MKQKIKIGIILGVEFLAITVILALIFFAGKKTYKVTFDLNGGILISGEVEQTVTQGKSATAPVVAKDGCYLHSWSGSFKQVTHDIVVKAVWEWETNTSVGFEYTSTENTDYCEIVKSYEHLYGDVFVGVYHDEKIILGMKDEAFRDRDKVTNVYMLDGMLYIGNHAFADCDNLESVELPGTLKELGVGAFENCTSLERIVFPDELEVIPERAFAGCTALKEIVIPASVKKISPSAFLGCTALEKITFETEDVIEIDEETEEEKIVGTNGLIELCENVFEDCDSLLEVVLPETLSIIHPDAFNNPDLTVYLTVKEEDAPEGFAPGWNGGAKIEWEYVPPVEDDEEEAPKKDRHRQ